MLAAGPPPLGPISGGVRVCYRFGGGFTFVEALGGLLPVAAGNPLTVGLTPSQPQAGQLITVQFTQAHLLSPAPAPND